jgi:hypothetical protein
MGEQRLHRSYRILAALFALGFVALGAWTFKCRPIGALGPMLIGPSAMLAAACLYCAIFGMLPRFGGRAPR